MLNSRQRLRQLASSLWTTLGESGLSVASYVPDGSQICLVDTFYKVELLAALQQALPVGGVAAVEANDWVSRFSVEALMLVHSMLDAGSLLADMYSKCPQLARGATLLNVYGAHVAKVGQLLLRTRLSDLHEHPDLLQHIANLETEVYRRISDCLWAEGSQISQCSAFSNPHLLAYGMREHEKSWVAAGHRLLQSRHAQRQQSNTVQAARVQASWNKYQEAQQAHKKKQRQAEASYLGSLQMAAQTAAQLLEQCKVLAPTMKHTAPAELLAGNIAAAYTEACRAHPLLEQWPLLTPSCGFEAVSNGSICIELKAGSAGYRTVDMEVDGGVLIVPERSAIAYCNVRRRASHCENGATCVVTAPDPLVLRLFVSPAFSLRGAWQNVKDGAAPIRREPWPFEVRLHHISPAEPFIKLECEPGCAVHLVCKVLPGLRCTKEVSSAGKLHQVFKALNFVFVEVLWLPHHDCGLEAGMLLPTHVTCISGAWCMLAYAPCQRSSTQLSTAVKSVDAHCPLHFSISKAVLWICSEALVCAETSLVPAQGGAMLRAQSLSPTITSTTQQLCQLQAQLRYLKRLSVQPALTIASPDPVAEVAKLDRELEQATALDERGFGRTPYSKFMRALAEHFAAPERLSTSFLEDSRPYMVLKCADGLCAALQKHVAPAASLLDDAHQTWIAQYLNAAPATMHLVAEHSPQLLTQLDQVWNTDMQTASKAAMLLYKQFPEQCNQLLLSMSRLAANGMCSTATSMTSMAESAAAQDTVKAYTDLLEVLRKSLISNAETQLHRSEVLRLRNTVQFVTKNKEKRFTQLLEAKKLLALSDIDEHSLATDSSRALACLQAHQHGVIIITDADGMPTVTSRSTSVNFGDVISSTGRADRTIRLVNHTSSPIHAKVMAHKTCINSAVGLLWARHLF